MKAIIWIIIVALVAWAIWHFMHTNSTAGIPSTAGDTSGQVQGASDTYFDASSTDQGQFDSKG